jgi:hypothetical protein
MTLMPVSSDEEKAILAMRVRRAANGGGSGRLDGDGMRYDGSDKK